MRLNIKTAPAKKKAKRNEAGLSSDLPFNALKDELLESSPIDLKSLGVVAPTSARPRFSRAVTEAGLAYRSISISPTHSVYFLIE